MGRYVRRTFYDVYADILNFLTRAGSSRITQIARYSNLPVDRAKKILKEMAEKGLIKEYSEEGRVTYTVTAKGYMYLELYGRLKKIVGGKAWRASPIKD